jgi:hypothetical protein
MIGTVGPRRNDERPTEQAQPRARLEIRFDERGALAMPLHVQGHVAAIAQMSFAGRSPWGEPVDCSALRRWSRQGRRGPGSRGRASRVGRGSHPTRRWSRGPPFDAGTTVTVRASEESLLAPIGTSIARSAERELGPTLEGSDGPSGVCSRGGSSGVESLRLRPSGAVGTAGGTPARGSERARRRKLQPSGGESSSRSSSRAGDSRPDPSRSQPHERRPPWPRRHTLPASMCGCGVVSEAA